MGFLCEWAHAQEVQGDVNLSLRMKYYSVTIQMIATELYFPVVLFIKLNNVVLS